MKCTESLCPKPGTRRGLCDNHYRRFMRNGHTRLITTEDRFWAKVNKRGPKHLHMKSRCWIWTGAHLKLGYGRIAVNKVNWQAHRYSWFLKHGRIPRKKEVCHHCDEPACVRPSHLFLGTHRENILDGVAKGRIGVSPKISIKKVREIKRLYVSGKYTQRELAGQFEISQQHVSDIINLKRRTNLAVSNSDEQVHILKDVS